MSESTGSNNEDKKTRARRQPKPDSVLTPTFSVARHSVSGTLWDRDQPGGLLQRQCACGTHTIGGGPCDACRRQAESNLWPRTAVEAVPESAESPTVLTSDLSYDLSQVPVHTSGGQPQSAVQAKFSIVKHMGEQTGRSKQTTKKDTQQPKQPLSAAKSDQTELSSMEIAPQQTRGVQDLPDHPLAHALSQTAVLQMQRNRGGRLRPAQVAQIRQTQTRVQRNINNLQPVRNQSARRYNNQRDRAARERYEREQAANRAELDRLLGRSRDSAGRLRNYMPGATEGGHSLLNDIVSAIQSINGSGDGTLRDHANRDRQMTQYLMQIAAFVDEDTRVYVMLPEFDPFNYPPFPPILAVGIDEEMMRQVAGDEIVIIQEQYNLTSRLQRMRQYEEQMRSPVNNTRSLELFAATTNSVLQQLTFEVQQRLHRVSPHANELYQATIQQVEIHLTDNESRDFVRTKLISEYRWNSDLIQMLIPPLETPPEPEIPEHSFITNAPPRHQRL